jgi:hypothetical protein
MNFLLCSAVSKYLGHFPEGLVEFHILIDAPDCPALGHPATVRAAAGTVALTTANDVFLDTVHVISTGGQVIESVTELRREGAVVDHVVAVLFRSEAVKARLSEYDLEAKALFIKELS